MIIVFLVALAAGAVGGVAATAVTFWVLIRRLSTALKVLER
jgi:hypothetical protein